jgi:hypothetical protein
MCVNAIKLICICFLLVISNSWAVKPEKTNGNNFYGIFYQNANKKYFSVGLCQRQAIGAYGFYNTNIAGFLIDRRVSIDGHDKGALLETSFSYNWNYKILKFGPSLGISMILEQCWNRVPPVEGDVGFPLEFEFILFNHVSIKVGAVKYLFPRNIHNWGYYDWKNIFNISAITSL